MIIAVDFDGVIHDYRNPAPGRSFGPPIEGSLDGIRTLQSRGHQLYIHTTKAQTGRGRQAVNQWLRYFHFPTLEILGKPGADMYVDDHGYKFTGWTDLCG